MPGKRPIADPRTPYRDFALFFRQLITDWEQEQTRQGYHEPFRYKVAGPHLGIDISMLSKFGQGRNLPTPHQCLLLARYFGRPVEDVLHAAGYPDVDGLHQIIEADETPRDPDLRAQILDLLKSASLNPEWKATSSQNPYKDNAEQWLATDIDPWEKGLRYTDMVYFWYQSRKPDEARFARKTGEMIAS